MSEKSKGDTYTQPPQPLRVNPLLSASVTGLTFDDFPNKPLLLPAAPPVVHQPINLPSPHVVPAGRGESKSLVTVGSYCDFDTESLDEINLNTTPEDSEPAQIDTNSNNELWEQTTNTSADSILSQAASSFSALPSVASSVFSTFSKRIYAGTTSRERTPYSDNTTSTSSDTNANPISQLDIQPAYIQHQHQTTPFEQSVAPPPFYAPSPSLGSNFFEGQVSTGSTSTSLPEPPKFYAPEEVPTLPTIGSTLPPTVASNQNTYRLSAKKKIYAPIPGLSDQTKQTGVIFDPSAVIGPITGVAPLQPPDAYFPLNQPQQQSLKQPQQPLYGQPPIGTQEEHKGAGSLFSLTNFVPSGVLQNLSGLVQSATGTLTQSVRSDPQQQHYQTQTHYQQPPVGVGYESNVFGVISPPADAKFPLPADNQQGSINQFAAVSSLPPQNLLYPGSISPVPRQQQHLSTIAPPTSFIEQTPKSQRILQSPPDGIFGVQSPTSSLQVSSATQPVKSFFDATILTNESVPTEKSTTTATASFFNSPSVQPASVTTTRPVPSTVEVAQPASTVAYADTTVRTSVSAVNSSQSEFTANTVSQQPFLFDKSGVPPAQLPPIAPPPTGQTSFRLQKGTRLYKNPLTSAETAPAYVTQLPSPVPAQAPPQTVFNPFAPTAPNAVQSNEFAYNTTNFLSNVPLEPQSVPLFVPLVSESESKEQVSSGLIDLGAVSKAVQSQSEHENISLSPIGLAQEILLEPPIHSPTRSDEKIIRKVKTEEDGLEFPAGSPEADTSNSLPKKDQTKVTSLDFFESTIEAGIAEKVELSATTAEAASVLPQQTAHQESNDPLKQEVRSSEFAQYLPPPPHSASAHGHSNPYRKGLTPQHPPPATAPASSAQPSLGNFFTPLPNRPCGGSDDFNFFAVPPPSVAAPSIRKQSEAAPTLSVPLPASTFFTASDTGSLAITTPIQQSVFPPLPEIINNVRQQSQQLLELAVNTEGTENDSESLLTVAPPLGFDNIVAEAIAQPSGLSQSASFAADVSTIDPKANALTDFEAANKASVNSFSKFFSVDSKFSVQEEEQKQEIIKKLPDPTSFFDSFAPQPPAPTVTKQQQQQEQQQNQQQRQQQQANEDQRIQNFFNNPPPQEHGGVVGDLNYDLVHSGLGVKDLQRRSLTPASNLVEPPSSSCSEFSELNTSNPAVAGQKPLTVQAEKLNKSSTERTANSAVGEASPVRILPTSTVAENAQKTVKHYEELPEEILHELRMANLLTSERGAATAPPATILYNPAIKHWFYKRPSSGKDVWMPFSHYDSALLETSLCIDDVPSNIVAVEGGRYEVNVRERSKIPVYWEGDLIEVRRCSWFYKGSDSKYVPYEEETADLLEIEYKEAAESGVWHKKIILSMGEQVVFHGPTVIVHFQQQQNTDAWGGTSQTTTRPRVVKRDLDDFSIQPGESQRVDHLLFMVHGIGSACDLKMRTVEEVVDEFRGIAQQLVQSHYKNSTEMGLVGRVEVLPISWHSHLHSEEMGIDVKLKSITLESIPKLRNFTNDTLLDVLFYTSPIYCQKIMNTVAASMNAVYLKYRARHPDFNGGISVAGHSLGSLILFDLLCHQNPMKECEEQNMENPDQQYLAPQAAATASAADANRQNEQIAAKQISYTMGPAGTGQPFISYAQLIFQPKKFFALGSPIGMFVTIRGIDQLGLDFRLPTCPGFYNIFHPFDPVAYRVEALINPDMKGTRPVLIPHHKGRKRMHLELKETMTRVTADLKQRFLDTFQTTLDSVNFLNRNKKEAQESMESEVGKVIEMQMQLEQQQQLQQQCHSPPQTLTHGRDSLVDQSSSSQFQQRPRTDSMSTSFSDQDVVDVDFPLGKLNDSKRVDYVLQEAPLEFFNEYLFALSSHVCYWDSEDTILFVMKEIYAGLGVSSDSQVPQQSMTIERPSSHGSASINILSPTG